jgi:hypothetical protein
LTARTENLRHLYPIGDTIKSGDEPLFGYWLLARAMLGDRNVIEPARRYLATPEGTPTSGGVIGRRAAVLALGLAGTSESIPVLIDAWHQSYYVNREIALALVLCRAYGVTDSLTQLITQSDKPLACVFGAQCLGRLFADDFPQRLGRLVVGSNYAVRNDFLLPYNALANEFLFRALIPAFGQEWR